MRRRGAGRVAASTGSALFLTLMASAAQASGHLPFGPPPEFGSGTAIAFGIIFPTEVGSFVSGSGANFVFGWSWQIPLSLDLHSRIAGGVDLALGSDEHPLRGRVGYRYGGHYLFAGLGGSFAHDGNALSPELGVKVLHWPKENSASENAFHLLARAEIDPSFERLRGVTLLLGWNVF